MTKWTRARRDPGRTYSDEETERTERLIERVRSFLAEVCLKMSGDLLRL